MGYGLYSRQTHMERVRLRKCALPRESILWETSCREPSDQAPSHDADWEVMRHSMAALTSSHQCLSCTWGVLASFPESCRIWYLLSQDMLSLDVLLMGMLASWRVLTKHQSRLASRGLPPAPDTNNQEFKRLLFGAVAGKFRMWGY